MTEDCKREVLRELLPQGQQYTVTMVGQLQAPKKTNCCIGMTDTTLVIADVGDDPTRRPVQGWQIPFDQMQKATTQKNLFGWQNITINTATEEYRMVLKDNTLGTHLDKNLQLQGMKFLCQRLEQLH